MQQQNTLKGQRRSTKPNATSKRHGRSSSGDADTTRSRTNAARSYRQSTMTREDDDGKQANRRSKKDNQLSGQRRRSAGPVAKRRSPVGGGRSASNAKSRSPEGSSRRAKQVTSNNNRGRTTPNSPRGSSAKRARSRR